MALRVLLADESHTIKKVFQLALQDYAVEVRPVNVGVDVQAITKSFQPDIIFADVLLQKRNGYDVCADMKNDTEASKIPVVLMWSGFMEIDEDKFEASMADDKLEKPFDVNTLRTLIQKLVPKTKTQNLSEYLTFPEMPEFEEEQKQKAEEVQQKISSEGLEDELTALNPTDAAGAESAEDDWSMENFESLDEFGGVETEARESESSTSEAEEDFQQVPLSGGGQTHQSQAQGPQSSSDPEAWMHSDENEHETMWVQKDFSQFQMDPSEVAEGEDEEPTVAYSVPEDKPPSREEPPQPPKPPSKPPKQSIQDASHLAQQRGQQDEPTQVTREAGTLDLQFSEGDDFEGDLELEAPPDQEPTQENNIPKMSAEEIEAIVRAQSKEVIEDVVWKVVPELASQIIKKELDRLLAEQDSEMIR